MTKAAEAGTLEFDLKRSRFVCADHVFDVVKPHILPLFKQKSSRANLPRRDLIMAILESTETHESSPAERDDNESRRVSAPAPPSVEMDLGAVPLGVSALGDVDDFLDEATPPVPDRHPWVEDRQRSTQANLAQQRRLL